MGPKRAQKRIFPLEPRMDGFRSISNSAATAPAGRFQQSLSLNGRFPISIYRTELRFRTPQLRLLAALLCAGLIRLPHA